MVDKAFDAFSQRRNTGTRDKLTERTKVETYNDPNRYQMPPRRRLGVVSQNKDTTVTPEKTNVTRLAESLSTVTPTLMDIIVNNHVKQNKEQIQLGIKDAAARAAFNAKDPDYVDNEWRIYGYEQQTAFMQGEDLGIQLQEAVQFKPVEQSWDEFYENWWTKQNELNPNLATMNPEHVEQFNKALQTGITKAKTFSMAEQVKDKDEAIRTKTVDYVTKDLLVQLSEGRELDNRYLTGIRDHIMGFHHSGQEASDFIFEAISNVIYDENIDLVDARNIVKLLKTDRGENGEIASYYNTKNKETVTLLDEITRRSNAKVNADNARMRAIDTELTTIQTDSKKYIKSKTNVEASLIDKALSIDVREKLQESWGNIEKQLNDYARSLRPLVQNGEITEAQFEQMYIKQGEALIDNEGIRSKASVDANHNDVLASQNQEHEFNLWISPPNVQEGTVTTDVRAFQIVQALENGGDPNLFFKGTNLTWDTLTADQQETIRRLGKHYLNRVTVGDTLDELNTAIKASDLILDHTLTAKQIRDKDAKEVETSKKDLEASNTKLDKQMDLSNAEEDILNNKYPVDPNTGVPAKNDIAIDHSDVYRKEQEAIKLSLHSRAKEYEWNQAYMTELNSWHESSPDFLGGAWENDPELQQELQEFHGSNTVAEDAPQVPFSGDSTLVYDYESGSSATINVPKVTSIADALENYFGFNKHSKNKEKTAAELTALARKDNPVKNVMSIKNWYEDKGYRPEAIGAILGNIAHETGKSFDWKQKEVTSKTKKGHGIFQLDHKMTQYKKFLKQEGAKDSLEMQMMFMHETIYGGWQSVPGYGNAKKLREVFETGTLEEITKAFEDLWEKPKPGSSDKRVEEAQNLHSNLYVDD